MSYLTWNKTPATHELKDHPTLQRQLILQLSAQETSELVASLRELMAEPQSELRHTLSDTWTIFWKLKEGESRSLLAHPERGNWVGTLALTREHLQLWTEKLEALQPGHSPLILSEQIEVDWVSNFELQIVSP